MEEKNVVNFCPRCAGLQASVDALMSGEDRQHLVSRCKRYEGEIAELRRLLRWAYEQMQDIEPVGAHGKIQTAWDCVEDSPEKAAVMSMVEEK